MRHLLTSIALALFPFSAQAASTCAPGTTTILSCTFSNGAKALVACQDGTSATYAFGKVGQVPDLALSVPIESLGYVPWPGVGSSVWDEVTFTNNGVAYVLWQSFDRDPNVAMPQQAGIVVRQGDKDLARLECDQGSITPQIDGLWDVFEALGQCYDRQDQSWAACQ